MVIWLIERIINKLKLYFNNSLIIFKKFAETTPHSIFVEEGYEVREGIVNLQSLEFKQNLATVAFIKFSLKVKHELYMC